ncbi:T9SS type A sorting domain-containing protein [Pontibacter qinzhouensis]|uniref:T9SS type A sorting domain-containing protein n=1 Tax=Pontibacter qinzhouensis TaxID=2603253 RepID=A0A5C8IQT6_9BACT|nr:T9SS type A sorting domain-containing protein [Pontibacter qinzhouensis]TXK23597.1 T9SS type A sorting domain-containing protein [Pontibacter qinzhouensis]
MKQIFTLLLLLAPMVSWAQSVTLVESGGWLESAYVKWQPVADVEKYNVYYSGEGITDQKIDDQLIRSYGAYYRADVLGLKAGTYTLKVVPVVSGTEGAATTTGYISVQAHDRSGFAFSNGRVPGAYKADGTVKSNAVILYITENTKNTISLDVTGANANPCVGLQTILEGYKKGKDARPLIIRLVGQITDLAYMDKGDIVIENNRFASSHITLEGVGDDAVADGWGIRIKNASNVEIRNIGSMNCNSNEGDNIGLQQDNDYIWVHHVDFFYGDAGSDADQAKGDGALDAKRSTYVTFSYNHFWDAGKSNLVGLSEGTNQGLYITFHHNWYDHSDSRHPRVRYYSAHVYNNYYDGNSKYGVGSTLGSSVFVEGNYFRNCKYPMLTSMQGSDVYDEGKQANDYSNSPTFSKENGGTIKAFNNYMTGQRRFVPYAAAGYPNATRDFDAYVATTRNETVANTVVSAYGSNTYNNFDTNASVMYTYTPDSPEEAREKVMQYAGRVNGGDFKWTFNNAVDDASSDVNAPLKAALVAYKTKLVAVQGDGAPATGGGNDDGDDNGNDAGNAEAMVHNFTLAGKTSTFYTITGNLSDSKGTVSYNGLTLTQCLKIESATNVAFTTSAAATLTLVFNNDFNGTIKVNGTDQMVSAGVLILTLPAGSHQLTKGSTTNLFYMSLAYNEQGAPLSSANPEKLTIVAYPNPAENNVIVTWKKDTAFTLYSSTGKILKTGITNQLFDLSDLSSGLYFIMISGEEGQKWTTRLMKR